MKLQLILTELFSQTLVQKLVDRFQAEQPGLEERIIRFYLQRFEQLKTSPKVREKDINKYSWQQLETLVDMNQRRTEDKNIKFSDSDLIYNYNNLKIYRANTLEACVKYGNGYSFCISARGEGNMYTRYRFGEDYTIYFVFDGDRTTEMQQITEQLAPAQNQHTKFIDPIHLLVIMTRTDYQYTNEYYDEDNGYTYDQPKQKGVQEYLITTANNDGEISTDNWYKVAEIQPKLLDLQHLFVTVDPDEYENKLHDIEVDANKKLLDLVHKHKIHYTSDINDYYIGGIYDVEKYKFVYGIIQGKPIINYQALNIDGIRLFQETRTDGISEEKWKELVERYQDEDDEEFNRINQVVTKQLHPTKEFMKYINDVWVVMQEYLREKNKLNIK